MLARIVPRRALVALVGCALALLGWLLLAPATPVAAIAYTVNTLTDTGAGLSTTGDLRFVINNVNLGSGNDTITITATGTINLTSALPHLTKGVTITGPTSGVGVTVNGGGANTVFIVDTGVTANISTLTIANGHGGSGGGILNNGTLTVTNTTFAGNVAPNSGGGIFNNNGGTLHVTNSTFSGNSAPGNDGGGIVNFGSGTLTVKDSTFTGNSAARGGGIQNLGSTVTLTNTIVAGNSATSSGPDLANAITSGGHNLFGKTSGATISGGSGDIVNNAPLLGALGSNGGPTQTIPLLAGSPAVGAVPHLNCTPNTDQRGLQRSLTGACAIGAFEPQTAAYTVGSAADTVGMDTLAHCQSAANATCKLRDALAYASSGSDTITFAPMLTGGQTITLTAAGGGTLTLGSSVTVTGPTSLPGVTVDGGCTFGGGVCTSGGVGTVFTVNSLVTASLSNLTIQHGNAGGIGNNGFLTVTNSAITSNSAGGGGGIGNGGTLTVTNSTITGNGANDGSGIYNLGTTTVTNSTISGNAGLGGGNGGGIENAGGTTTLTNTIVAGNSAGGGSGPDLSGTITSGGHNLVGTISGSSGITNGTNGDIVNNAPLLGALGSNGGTTQTIPLLAGSPAIGHGSTTVCATAPVSGVDQRGNSRPAGSCAIGAFEPPHQPATYTVGSAADTVGMDTLAHCLDATNATCKLRDALWYAVSGLDTVQFNSTGRGPITLTAASGGTLTLGASVTVQGPTSGTGVTVDGGCTFNMSGNCTGGGVRVFLVSGGVTVSLSNLTIQHGNTGSSGGGIYNDGGTVTVTNSTLSANSTSGGDGGGIYNNGGTVTVTNSTLAGNSAVSGNGAGIYNNGTLTLTNSTLSGNGAGVNGGGIYNAFGRTLTLTNSTLSGNSASNGGGIFNRGILTLTNGTLAGNTASTGTGGGIYNLSGNGTLNLRNTVVAGNTGSPGPDISGAVATTGNNLVGSIADTTGITNGTNGDIVNNTPLLGALGSNGGPTQTIPLLAGSPALGAGDASATGCASTGSSGVNGKDQRGFGRSVAKCSIGAFEPQTATYTVGATTDTGTMDTFADCTTAGNTTCQLRDAIAYAASGLDTVVFNSHGRGPITLKAASGGTLTLGTSVTISGPTSGAAVIVDGGCTFNGTICTANGVTVFAVNNAVTASLSNLTIQHGNTASGGGGILNAGTLLSVTNCTITGNTAAASGGGIAHIGDTLTVTNSTFTGNSATFDGGGIYNDSGALTVTVTNSTITNNTSGGGGGIFNSSTLTVTNSTITGNSATNGGAGGGGIYNPGTLTLTNTIVAGNMSGSGPDLNGTFISGGHNLFGNTNGGSGFVASDYLNFIPFLGTLGSNGGPTQTIPLLAGSVAIAHGDPAVCANTSGTAPVAGKDQRGVARPAALCAIGAFEPLLSAISPPSGSVSGGSTVTLTGAGFAAGASVTIGNVPCTNVQIASSTTLTCTTGAHGLGAVDVVVTVGGATGTLAGGYTYGVVGALPGPQPTAPAPGSPSPLPGGRPPGTTGGPTPNPLPPSRP